MFEFLFSFDIRFAKMVFIIELHQDCYEEIAWRKFMKIFKFSYCFWYDVNIKKIFK